MVGSGKKTKSGKTGPGKKRGFERGGRLKSSQKRHRKRGREGRGTRTKGFEENENNCLRGFIEVLELK